VAVRALEAAKLGLKADLTEYLVFLGTDELEAIVDLCDQQWDTLTEKSGKGGKKKGADGLPEEIGAQFDRVLRGGKAADVGLFGRMLADLPDRNIDAAAQVAHAISTHRINAEFDYFTAVDDLLPADQKGADMIGTVEFNSACFYRYLNVDLDQLTSNLGGDLELASETARAYLRAAVAAIPTGKQNSMAAHNPPSFVMAVARTHGFWNLANAFLKPVRSMVDRDIVEASIAALDAYWAQLQEMYGTDGLLGCWVASLSGNGLEHLANQRVGSVEGLIQEAVTAVAAPQAA
jgi:CRISPR system Cascade subunit CasC